jgi:hypothetical protein
MKRIDLLPITEIQKKELNLRSQKYLAYCGIYIEIIDFTNNILKVIVEQKKLINGFILTQSQLVGRAGAFFDILENMYKIYYTPITYKPMLNEINIDWIKEKNGRFKNKK